MNKKMFESYWIEQGQQIDWIHYNGYDYAFIELMNSDNLQQQGCDEVNVVGKFIGEDLVCIGYDSHVAYSTRLSKEYWDIVRDRD